LCITTAGFIVTNRQRDAIDDGDAGCTSSGNAFGLGIVVVEKLLATQFLGAYVVSTGAQICGQIWIPLFSPP
jgi:UDP-N-acetylmuramyl pentapeptide phosphotransferase/UDP-N-acetylglucosamine-1-phosphate transferase